MNASNKNIWCYLRIIINKSLQTEKRIRVVEQYNALQNRLSDLPSVILFEIKFT